MKKQILFAFTALLWSVCSFSQPGTLDVSFGINGMVKNNFGDMANALNGLALQSDGKIIAAGELNSNGEANKIVLARYNENGQLDDTFGSGGSIISSYGAKCAAKAVAIQPDGKIVVAGFTGTSEYLNSHTGILVARYTTSGEPDLTFNSTGAYTEPETEYDVLNAIALQDDGKIVVGGRKDDASILLRLNTDGTLDTTFNGTGYADAIETIVAVKVLDDGKILAGSGYGSFIISKFNTDGTKDTSFANGGVIQDTSLPGLPTLLDFDVTSEGDIIAVGNTQYETFKGLAAMYTSSGESKTSFGNNGYVLDTSLAAGQLSHNNVVVVEGERIYMGAGVGPGTNYDIRVTAYNLDGVPDQGFGNSGSITYAIGTATGHDYIRDILIMPDGKIVTGGKCVFNGFSFALSRLWPAEVLAVSDFNVQKNIVNVYPNPVTPSSKLSLNLEEGATISLNLYDLNGRLIKVLSTNQNVSSGNTEIPLYLEDISKGVYILEVCDADKIRSSLKIVK